MYIYIPLVDSITVYRYHFMIYIYTYIFIYPSYTYIDLYNKDPFFTCFTSPLRSLPVAVASFDVAIPSLGAHRWRPVWRTTSIPTRIHRKIPVIWGIWMIWWFYGWRYTHDVYDVDDFYGWILKHWFFKTLMDTMILMDFEIFLNMMICSLKRYMRSTYV
jgi:hypothetical protein